MFLDHTLIVIMFRHLMYSLMMRSIINLSGAGSDSKEQVEAGDPYSSVETPIADSESIRSSEERVSLPIQNSDHHQRTTLGYVPIYNHSYTSNCEYEMDFDNELISIKTVRLIKAGEELFINYNGDWNDSKPLWFEAT